MEYKNQLITTGELNDVGGYIRTNAKKSRRVGIEIVNRQELSMAYYRSNIITSRVSSFLETGNQIGEKSIKVEIPIERSIDINSELDFYLAEKIAEKYNLCSKN